MEQQEQKDMTVMEKSGGYSYNCNRGYHDFDKSLTRLEIAPGGLTKVYMTCYICKREIVVEAPLNVNDLIAREEGLVQPDNQTIKPMDIVTDQPAQNDSAETISMDEFWKRLKGK